VINIEGPRQSKTASPRALAAAGYVEEEYLVSGTADLYGYDDAWETVLARPAVTFRTRLLVRRPGDDTRASGDVLLEPLHPAGDMASSWARLGADGGGVGGGGHPAPHGPGRHQGQRPRAIRRS
jgi:hypothetical protein